MSAASARRTDRSEGKTLAEKMPALPCDLPDIPALIGRSVDLERIDVVRHEQELWWAIGADPELWRRIPPGPFDDRASFHDWLSDRAERSVLYAIVDKLETRGAAGLFFLLNIDAAMGVLELGLVYGPALSRRTQGTEAFFLLARYVFDVLRYRRLEWRCNSDHDASRRAAQRFGFTFEGIMRQAMWMKGANSDTALHAMLDREWPRNAARLDAFLAPDNFAADGSQIRRLGRPRPSRSQVSQRRSAG
jgi:RimJ/RimL family protein N-acetyltransferase